MQNFLFSNFELVTRNWKNKNSTIELLTRDKTFYLFFNFELVTKNWKNKSLPFE